MIVVIYREGNIEIVAGEQTRLLATLGHVPTEGVDGDRVSPVASCPLQVVSYCRPQLQLHMLFLENPGRSHEADGAGGEDRLGISHAKRLQTLHSLEKFGSHLVKRKFGIATERGIEVGQSQAKAGVGIEMRAQLRHARGGQREANCMRVSTEAREQSGAGFQRV